MTTTTTPLLDRLREATREHHARIERNMSALGDDVTVDGYAGLLTRFLGYYAPVENAVMALAPEWEWLATDYSERRKTPRLQQDLVALGKSQDNLRYCTNFPVLDTLPKVLGYLYVAEGSTLGGQYISRHLTAKLGLTAETGTAFFSGYGEQTGHMWQCFRTLLTDYPMPDAAAEEDVITTAVQTFETLDAWLGQE